MNRQLDMLVKDFIHQWKIEGDFTKALWELVDEVYEDGMDSGKALGYDEGYEDGRESADEY